MLRAGGRVALGFGRAAERSQNGGNELRRALTQVRVGFRAAGFLSKFDGLAISVNVVSTGAAFEQVLLEAVADTLLELAVQIRH